MNYKYILFLTVFCFSFFNETKAQSEVDSTEYYQAIYFIETYNGGQFIGKIIQKDDREVTIETKDKGKVVIPKFEIKVLKEVKEDEINAKGNYVSEEVFSTRYFLTTNALPIKKGENYMLINLYGPEIHFGVSNNLGMGIMTSWVGVPVVGSIKYSIPLSEKSNIGVGALVGSGTWVLPDFYLGLPYGVYSYGDRHSNFSISMGYGVIGAKGGSTGNALLAVGGMKKLSKTFSLIFDSFIVPQVRSTSTTYDPVSQTSTMSTSYSPVAILLPGLRIHGGARSSFQFGFAGFYSEKEFTRLPIPFLQWYIKL